MTDKEAIEHLKELKILRIEFPNALQEQALDLAIKALEEEECKSEQITDLLETEWGYKGIREDVARIMRGGKE